METCILVASGTRASIYKASRADLEDMQEIKQLSHEANRDMNRDMLTDKPGSYANSAGPRSDFQKADPKEEEKHKFALHLVHEIKELLYGSKFKRLIIAAAPHFQGLVKEKMKHLKFSNEITVEYLGKDYTASNRSDLLEELKKFSWDTAKA